MITIDVERLHFFHTNLPYYILFLNRGTVALNAVLLLQQYIVQHDYLVVSLSAQQFSVCPPTCVSVSLPVRPVTCQLACLPVCPLSPVVTFLCFSVSSFCLSGPLFVSAPTGPSVCPPVFQNLSVSYLFIYCLICLSGIQRWSEAPAVELHCKVLC